MNILILTKFRFDLTRRRFNSAHQYVKENNFFDGYNNGFKKSGHKTFLNWDESFFLTGWFKCKYPRMYRLFSYILKITGVYRIDRYLFSRRIARECRINKIDLIFTEINSTISPEIIRKASPSTIISQWFGVFPEMVSEDVMSILKEYDFVWGPCEFDYTKTDFDLIGNHKYIGCAVNQSQYYFDFDSKYAHDVVFIGGISSAHSNRIEILEAVAQHFENFAFYGYGIENVPNGYKLKSAYRGFAEHCLNRKIYSSSKIAINLTLNGFDRVLRGFNARLFEIAACGGALQIVPYDNKIAEFFDFDNEVVTFGNTSELIKKISYYLQDDNLRASVAVRAQDKSLYFTYDVRSKQVTKAVEAMIKSK